MPGSPGPQVGPWGPGPETPLLVTTRARAREYDLANHLVELPQNRQKAASRGGDPIFGLKKGG